MLLGRTNITLQALLGRHLLYEKAGPSCLLSKWEDDDTDSHKMETPLGRQTLHCDNCYQITVAARVLLFFHTVSTLWESKYFSDYPLYALIRMIHSVCCLRCYSPRMFFFSLYRIGRSTLLRSSGSSAQPTAQ